MRFSNPTRLRRMAPGQALIVFALASIPMIAMVGVSVDLGNALLQKRIAQNAADAAALAGARGYSAGNTQSTINTSITNYATSNTGPGGSTTVVSSQWTNSTGTEVGATTASAPSGTSGVKVRTQRTATTAFLRLLNWTTITVEASAAASITSTTTTTAGASLLVLNSSSAGALTLGGNGTILAGSGGAQVNSSSATAINASGNALITTDTASGINVNMTGDCVTAGNARVNGSTNCPATGSVTGAAAIPDPLASMATPTFTTTAYSAVACSGNTALTISPGVYPSISASANCVLTMSPGQYVIKGNLTVSGNAQVLGSGGVFLYVTRGGYPANSGTCGIVTLAGNGAINLVPQSSGTYQNMSLFYDRNCTSTVTISGNASMTGIKGSIYSAGATVSISGNGTMPGQIIADKVNITGNGNITVAGTTSVWTSTTSSASGSVSLSE
ncbi:MAG: pilus assembly protein TadG-related protein [Chloroflexi bacterium]|nr:pilus assembly protein TadG-related protein [Chloroflexota bacterium]